jgi:hypothetical protein
MRDETTFGARDRPIMLAHNHSLPESPSKGQLFTTVPLFPTVKVIATAVRRPAEKAKAMSA